MATIIKTLRDWLGNQIIPRTRTIAVFDDANVDLKTTMENNVNLNTTSKSVIGSINEIDSEVGEIKSSLVEVDSQLIQDGKQIARLSLTKKTAFIEQFITGFYSRGQLSTEKVTENLVTETNITVARSLGYDGVDIANTTPFKEGTVIVIKYDDGTYLTHFITSVVNSTSLTIIPPLAKDITANTKIERCWFNSAHPGKFYMRYLAQRLANATETNNGYGENAFYANFDGTSADDIGTVVGTATIGYSDPVNIQSGLYRNIIESGVGKNAYINTSTIGGGIRFPSFYVDKSEKLSLKLFLMNKVSTNTTKVAIKSQYGEITSFTISGATSQIMKPYTFEFFAPSNTNLIWVEITNQTASTNTIIIDEVRVMKHQEVENYILSKEGVNLVIGDSWVAGDLGNSTEREPITTHLATLLPNSTIINKGFGGNTIQDVLARFNTDVVPFKPDTVILNVGTNDSYNPASGVFEPNSVDYFEGKIKEFIQKCNAIGAKPVIIGVPALAEQDISYTDFLLNDRARLYNKRIYKSVFPNATTGAVNRLWRTAIDGDTTPSIANIYGLLVSNTISTNISYFDDSIGNQEILVLFSNNNTTLVNSGSLKLKGGINWTPTTFSSITLYKNLDLTSGWIEKCRTEI